MIGKKLFSDDINPEEIHKTTIRILEEIGIPVASEKSLRIFDSLGCDVDYKTRKVRIGEEIVSRSLSPKTPFHKIYDRSGKNHKVFGKNKLLFTSGACAIKERVEGDNYTQTTLEDLKKFTILHDYFDVIDIVHTTVDANDLSQNELRTSMAATVLKNTKKSCWFLASTPQAVEDIFRMGLAIRGSEKDLRQKPFFRIACASDSVLGFSKNEIETLLRCAELGIPTGCEHYPIMGLTAPLSVSAALAINNANYLCAHVLKTSIDPKNQSIFPVLAGSVNMNNGEIITSSPEIWKYYTAGIKMADYYGLPSSALVSSESKDIDMQLAFEKSMGVIISASMGANNIFDATGAMDSMNMASMEDIVIESEFISAIKKYLEVGDMENSDRDFELIKRSLKNKMYFLDDEHTLKNFKEFLWDSDLLTRINFDNWIKSKDNSIEKKANNKANIILREHQPPELPEDIVREIDLITKQAKERSSIS